MKLNSRILPPRTSEETVEHVHKKILQNPEKLLRRTSLEIQMPPTMAHSEETLDDETLQAITRSGHNGR